jgi:tetratricopeptide (TPR) repeat protein
MNKTLIILLCICLKAYGQTPEEFYNVGQYSKAIKAFKTLKELNTEESIVLAKAYCAKGMLKECLRTYQHALADADTKEFIKAKFSYSKLLQSQKKVQAADSLYASMLAVMPDNAEFLFQRGKLAEQMNAPAYHQFYLQALSIDSTHIKAAHDATEYFITVENYKLATQIATKTLQLVPETPRLINLLAQICYRQEKWNESLEYIAQLENLKAELPKFIYEIKGNNYLRLQKPEKAIADFKKALQLDDKDPDICLKLAELYLTTAQPEKATPYLRAYRLLRDTSMWEYNYQMGNYFMQTNAHRMAFRYYDLCHKENLNHEASQYYRAVAADNFMKEKSEVLDYYTNYLETWENDKDAKYKNLATRRATDIRQELFMEE